MIKNDFTDTSIDHIIGQSESYETLLPWFQMNYSCNLIDFVASYEFSQNTNILSVPSGNAVPNTTDTLLVQSSEDDIG